MVAALGNGVWRVCGLLQPSTSECYLWLPMCVFVSVCVGAFMCAERHSGNGRRAHQRDGQVSVWSQTCQRGFVCRFGHMVINWIKRHSEYWFGREGMCNIPVLLCGSLLMWNASFLLITDVLPFSPLTQRVTSLLARWRISSLSMLSSTGVWEIALLSARSNTIPSGSEVHQLITVLVLLCPEQ